MTSTEWRTGPDPRNCSKCQTPESGCSGGQMFGLPACCLACAVRHGATHAPEERGTSHATTSVH